MGPPLMNAPSMHEKLAMLYGSAAGASAADGQYSLVTPRSKQLAPVPTHPTRMLKCTEFMRTANSESHKTGQAGEEQDEHGVVSCPAGGDSCIASRWEDVW